MDALERLHAERACERLMMRYARFVDGGNASGVADLFTEDGQWIGADGRGMLDRSQILAGMSAREGLTRRQSRHVITNILVDVESPERATGIAYLINFRHDAESGDALKPAPADHAKFVGDYHLRFRCEDGTWKIEHLQFDLAFLRRAKPR